VPWSGGLKSVHCHSVNFCPLFDGHPRPGIFLLCSPPRSRLCLSFPNAVLSSQPRRSPRSKRVSRRSCQAPANTNVFSCFPALGFTTPSDVPASTNGWWCDPVNEYAFLGFSYEVTACELHMRLFSLSIHSILVLYLGQSLSQLQKDFANIRNNFNGRYVRLYGACDREGF
jgi:hypothetical protein